MLVGIVMPVYNQVKQYIYESIRAIEAQTFRNFKLTIVLDGPNEQTVQAIYDAAKMLTMSYKIVHLPQNKGFANALNEGFAHLMDCTYFTWVSSDDRPLPHYVQTLVQQMQAADRGTSIVYSLYYHINEQGERIKRTQSYYDFMRTFKQRDKYEIMQVNFIGVSHLFTKEAFIQAGRYNPAYKMVADHEFWMRLLKTGNIHFVNDFLFEYRLDGKYSNTTTTPAEQLFIDSMSASADLRKKFGDIPHATIIMRLYNDEPSVIQAIDSVLKQTMSNFHLVIIDDASDDFTYSKVYPLKDARILPIRLFNKRGKAAVMNLGLKFALGPLVMEMTGKDWLEPHTLAVMTKALQQQPASVAVAYANRKLWHPQTEPHILSEGPVVKEKKLRTKYEVLTRLQMPYPRLYRKAALNKIGGWPEIPKLFGTTATDLHLMLLLSEEYKFHWIDATLYHERLVQPSPEQLLHDHNECEAIANLMLQRWQSPYIPEVIQKNKQNVRIQLW